MDEVNEDAPEVLETPEEEVIEVVEDVEAIKAELETIKAEKAEIESKNKQLYERLKKPNAKEGSSLTAKDFLAIKDANVSAEDFDEVQEFASFKGISISEALKHPIVKTLINERTEERKTAQATATRSPRGTQKQSGEDLLAKAERTGEMPDTDEGMTAIFQARQARRFKHYKK